MSNKSRTFPLIDLHRHLDGNIRLETILELAQQHGVELPAYNSIDLSKHVYIQDKTTDLLAFLQKLDIGISVLATLEDCKRVAYENVCDALSEGLHHVELRFSPYYMAKNHGLSVPGVVEAVLDGVNCANNAHSYNAKLIGILSRTFGVEACHKELQAILSIPSPTLVGLDLAGDEKKFPAHLFVEHFTKARDAGLRITVHAGEADGPSSIWNAITLLGASRIGHGVTAIEDNKLLDYMAKHTIGIESCILSNYQTGTWLDVANHPVRQFLEKGIEVCLNTDDPGVSNNTLSSEYEIAQQKLKLSTEQLQTLKMNSLNQAFLTPNEKNAIKDLR